MAVKKISELVAAAAADGTEVLPIVQSAATVKGTINQLGAETLRTTMPLIPTNGASANIKAAMELLADVSSGAVTTSLIPAGCILIDAGAAGARVVAPSFIPCLSSSIAWHAGSTRSLSRLKACFTWRPVDCVSMGLRKVLPSLPPPPPVTRLTADSARPAAAGTQPLKAIEHTLAPRMSLSGDIAPSCANARVK